MKTLAALILYATFALQRAAAQPAHLEPVSAFDRDDYIQIVYQRLVGKRESSLWMIGLPSFVPEYAVVVRSGRDASDLTKVSSVVEFARAEKPIFGWEDEENGFSHVKYDDQVAVQRTTKVITESDVTLLASAAFEVLKKTRIADSPRLGLDGETLIFSFDGLAGRIWCPDVGEPALLQKVWAALADYVRAQNSKAEADALASFRATCVELQKGANQSPSQRGQPSVGDRSSGT
jgi:hypothetical protein